MSSIELFDTHCHVHEVTDPSMPLYQKWYSDNQTRTAESVLAGARAAGVVRMLCVGTTLADSELAVRFAEQHEGVWAAIGIHPHEARHYIAPASSPAGLKAPARRHRVLPEVAQRFHQLAEHKKVVAIGECGLDYFYGHSSPADQAAVLRFQLELGTMHKLPLSFHVRSAAAAVTGEPCAFDDFWRLLSRYPGTRGVLHSFTDSAAQAQRASEQGLYIGVNGIATFTKDPAQRDLYRSLPLSILLLETDAPFLTPQPFRGRVCESKHVRSTAEFLAHLRQEPLERIAKISTENARALFNV